MHTLICTLVINSVEYNYKYKHNPIQQTVLTLAGLRGYSVSYQHHLSCNTGKNTALAPCTDTDTSDRNNTNTGLN